MFLFLFLFFSMLLLCSFLRLKELFQVKIGLTKSLLFFWKMPKIWVGRTTLSGEKKKEDGLTAHTEFKVDDLALAEFFFVNLPRRGFPPTC